MKTRLALKWISIKKRLPHPNQLVVLAHRRSDVGIDVRCSNGSYARKWCKDGFYQYWLPLPPHPIRGEAVCDPSFQVMPYITQKRRPK